MEQTIFEKNGGKYIQQGDYFLPYLAIPDTHEYSIGVWGQRRRGFLKEHHRVLYYNLLTSGKLNAHLADIDEQADEMFYRLVKDLAEKEGVTEQLKADNCMLWVQQMNNIRNWAAEIVNDEIIFI